MAKWSIRAHWLLAAAVLLLSNAAFGGESGTGVIWLDGGSEEQAQCDFSSDEWGKVIEGAFDSTFAIDTVKPLTGGYYNTGTGTGFIIDEEGYALTNSHVAGEGKGTNKAVFAGGESHPFRVIASGHSLDVALIRIDAAELFKPVKLGRSSELKVAQPVITVGNPGGKGLTIETGTISGVGRHLAYAWDIGATFLADAIQTSTDTTNGNSGGPLLNGDGEVVAIVSASSSEVDRITMSLPIDRAIASLPDILTVNGCFGFELGMTLDPLGTGVVTGVAEGSPAQAAGVKPGDIVTCIDGKPVVTGLDFYLALIDREPGEMLRLVIQRDGYSICVAPLLGKIIPRPAEQMDGLVDGLTCEYYEGEWTQLPDFESIEPTEAHVTDHFDLGPYKGKGSFGLKFTGYIEVPIDGAYYFHTASNDGSRLYVGERVVVDNDGLHLRVEQRGCIRLEAGLHPIRVVFFVSGGGEDLTVLWQGPGIDRQSIPAGVLHRHRAQREGE